MQRFALALFVSALAFLVAGCVHNGPPYVTPERLDKGLVIVLPGIEGPSTNNIAIRNGLMKGDVPCAIEIHNWLAGRPGASYAFSREQCLKRADEIAARIAAYRADHPDRPVFVVGHSGGGAMAMFVAEAVGPEHPLAGVVTLAPALSPTYDLTRAVTGCGGRLVNCFTKTDVMLLSLTSAGKNFDGVPGSSAGYEGFSLPPGAPQPRRAAFDYVRQIEWTRGMAKQGNLGGHLGWTSSPWVAKWIAPIIRQWEKEFARKER